MATALTLTQNLTTIVLMGGAIAVGTILSKLRARCTQPWQERAVNGAFIVGLIGIAALSIWNVAR